MVYSVAKNGVARSKYPFKNKDVQVRISLHDIPQVAGHIGITHPIASIPRLPVPLEIFVVVRVDSVSLIRRVVQIIVEVVHEVGHENRTDCVLCGS